MFPLRLRCNESVLHTSLKENCDHYYCCYSSLIAIIIVIARDCRVEGWRFATSYPDGRESNRLTCPRGTLPLQVGKGAAEYPAVDWFVAFNIIITELDFPSAQKPRHVLVTFISVVLAEKWTTSCELLDLSSTGGWFMLIDSVLLAIYQFHTLFSV